MTDPTPARDVFPYRRKEIDGLANSERYHIKIDARNEDGYVPTTTKWMGITSGELFAIREILREDKPDPTLVHRHPMMALGEITMAVYRWCQVTGTEFEFGSLDTDADLAAVSEVLLSSDMAATWWLNGGHLAVVLVAGAHLADLTLSGPCCEGRRSANLAEATRRVLDVATHHLGTPTGYEGQEDLLARRIHEDLSMDQL